MHGQSWMMKKRRKEAHNRPHTWMKTGQLLIQIFEEIFGWETLWGSGGIERHHCVLFQAIQQAAVPWNYVQTSTDAVSTFTKIMLRNKHM